MNFASPDAADVSMSDHVSRCSGLCLESRTGRRQPSQHRRRHDGLRELPKRFCQYSLPEVQRRYSAAAERSLSLAPTNSCSAVAVLAILAESNVSSGRAAKRRHSAAAIGSFPGAVKRLEPSLELRQHSRHRCDHVRSREPLFWLGLGAFPEHQRCLNARPRKKRANGWLLSGERPTAF